MKCKENANKRIRKGKQLPTKLGKKIKKVVIFLALLYKPTQQSKMCSNKLNLKPKSFQRGFVKGEALNAC